MSVPHQALQPHVLERGDAWRLFCPVFLHGGILHIFMNMSALRNIGGAVEEAFGRPLVADSPTTG